MWHDGIFKGRLTETFALICGPVNEDFGANDVAEGQKHLHQLGVSELLRQVVYEEVTALRSRNGAACVGKKSEV